MKQSSIEVALETSLMWESLAFCGVPKNIKRYPDTDRVCYSVVRNVCIVFVSRHNLTPVALILLEITPNHKTFIKKERKITQINTVYTFDHKRTVRTNKTQILVFFLFSLQLSTTPTIAPRINLGRKISSGKSPNELTSNSSPSSYNFPISLLLHQCRPTCHPYSVSYARQCPPRRRIRAVRWLSWVTVLIN